MIVAGEASGDALAAGLVAELKKLDPQIEFFGCAGPKMRAAGVEPVVNADELAVVGVPAIVRSLPLFLRIFQTLKLAAIERKPDAVILVDFPEFNLKLARSLKKRGFGVIYYVSPQIWAWRKYRINTIRRSVDLLISILPFETGWYSENGIEHVEYVGHPLAGNVEPSITKEVFCDKHDLDPKRPIVSMLPGSRRGEIARHLPIMVETAGSMLEADPSIQFLFAFAPTTANNTSRTLITHLESHQDGFRDSIRILEGETYDALNASDAAAVTSGTATLEAALIGTPMTVVYKVTKLDHAIFQRLIDVEHIGLVNLIAGERIAKELIQDEFTPKLLASELFRLLKKDENAAVRSQLKSAAERLGGDGASKRAAEAVIDLLLRKD